MGLALASLLTSCGGSAAWTESPDGWAEAPMPITVSAPAKPKKPKKAPDLAETPKVKATAEEAAAEPKKSSWWNKKKDEEVAKPEAAKMVPKTAPAAPKKTAEAATEPKKKHWWNNDKKEKKAEVAEKKVEKKPEPPRPKATPVVKKNGKFPTAERSKFFSSHVLSPYDNRSINVSGVASGTLVADPRYPLDQKKYFIVP